MGTWLGRDFQWLAPQGAAQSLLSPEKVPEAIYVKETDLKKIPVVKNLFI